jgi:hypothetical protein
VGPRRIHIANLGCDDVRVVRTVQTQEWLALIHALATIDEALNDLARDSKA